MGNRQGRRLVLALLLTGTACVPPPARVNLAGKAAAEGANSQPGGSESNTPSTEDTGTPSTESKPKPSGESETKSPTDTSSSSGKDRGSNAGKDAGDDTEKNPGDDNSKEPAPTTVDNATHGKGGPTGDKELKSASGLNFIMNAPADVHTSGKAYGVLVLLHGSTASNYRNFVKQMAKVATKYDLIRVSVLAPNGQGWNEGGEVAAADKLHALVQDEILKKYNVDKTKILFSGQSSGGGFLSTNFIPQHAKDYKGGAFLQCGAAAPRVNFNPDDATRKNFRMHFEITTGDPIWPKSYAGATAKYKSLGMTFTQDQSKPGGHCAFDQQQVILDHIDFVLGKK